MTEELYLEPAAFLDQWKAKIFLGQEFLTWLWINSEISSHIMDIKGHGAVELWFENRLHLVSGEGQSKKSVTCQTPDTDWAEAHTALKENKKLTQGRLKIRTEEKEWALTLNAETLAPQGVKLPPTFTEGEEEEGGEEGRFLERVALINELIKIVEALFVKFLSLRLSDEWQEDELPKMRRWLAKK